MNYLFNIDNKCIKHDIELPRYVVDQLSITYNFIHTKNNLINYIYIIYK